MLLYNKIFCNNMSKPRTIHTIESLLARTIEVGTCMEWTGYFRNKTPSVFHNGKIHGVRRVIRELQNKKMIEGLFFGCTCNNPRCVNPDHIAARNQKTHVQQMSKKVDYMNPRRLLKLTASAQVRRKLTDEQLHIILTSDKPRRELGAEFSVHPSLISRIRQGKAHRMSAARNNPFFRLIG